MTAPAAGHTPGPYKVTEDGHGIVIRVCEAPGKPVASMWLNGDDAKATADFIVRCVNSHADLLKALENQMQATILLLSKLEYSQQDIEDCTSEARNARASARAPSSKGERM